VTNFVRLDQSSRDWLSSDTAAGRVLLGAAVAAGTALRFGRLDAFSMTADEGAAWAAAVEPVHGLLQLQPQLDSGKLALYDLLLHCWIRIFGDSLSSIRGLSAAIGSVSIVLVFAMIRELCQTFADGESKSGELAAGFAALMFATNVGLVQSARTARMYPLMTAAELAQIFFFIRTHRQPNILNCILASLFLAVAIAANFTAAFLVLGEGIWIGYLLLARKMGGRGAKLRMAGPALSLAAGVALLLPFLPAAVAVSRAAVRGGAIDWIRYQAPLSWSYDVLRNNVGNRSLFRVLLGLAAFGIWRHRSDAVLPSIFMAAAIVGPFAAVAILSLLGRPMMVERYVMPAQIGFLGLAAIGAAAFRSRIGAILVLVVIVWLSARALRHSSGFWVDWKGAAAIACANSSTYTEIGVVPEYAVNAVRYHLPPERRALALGLDSRCGSSQILILSPGAFIPSGYISELDGCYPQLLGRATRVEVRAR
jgi:mannosyltransferase